MDIRIERRPGLERGICDRLMSDSEPWRTLGYRSRDADAVSRSADGSRVLAAVRGGEVLGFCVSTAGAMLGEYLKLLVVEAAWRGRGIGQRLLTEMESRAFREWPNVYLCVSDFNTAAQGFYLHAGYREIGRVPDLLVPGRDEILMRKTIAPWRNFEPQSGRD